MGERRVHSPPRFLQRVGRGRVPLGFVAAGVAFWYATPSWTSLTAGAAVASVGEVLRLWAAGHIKKGREVTVSGPYRLTRHPLYLGSLVMGLGFVVAAENVVVATIVVGYLVIMLGVAITLEEAMLRERFGGDYDRYADGKLDAGDRRFSLSLARSNGEYRTCVGFAAALGVLGFKIWL
jgi:protein-S-isoprenylcysteine O-methyltransferase Ste14